MPGTHKLTEKISLFTKTRTDNGHGGFTVSDSAALELGAHVTPVRGMEKESGGHVKHFNKAKFVIYARGDITTDAYVVWRGVHYDIKDIDPLMNGDQFMSFFAEKGSEI